MGLENQENPENKLSNEEYKNSLGFIITYLIFWLAMFFYYSFALQPKYNGFLEILAFTLIIIVPIIFIRFKLWLKLISSIILFIISAYTGILLANRYDLELAVLGYVPLLFFISLIIVTISHFILKKSAEFKRTTKIVGISLLWLATIFIIILSIFSIHTKYVEYKNYNLINDIQCKGAYTTTPSNEIKKLCDMIDPIGSQEEYRISFKNHCQEVIAKIEVDKYYFDDTAENINRGTVIRTPSNYISCANQKRGFLESGYINPDYTGIVRPEILDPELCNHLNQSDPYFGGGHVADNCYSRVAIATGDVSLCEKTRFPHQCYSYVARERNDPSICENIDPDFAKKYPEVKQRCLELKG